MTTVRSPHPSASVVHTHVLENGLTVLAEPMPWVRSAAFTLTVPAGAVWDPAGRQGQASMVAEWIMRGAGGRDSRELVEALDNLGVSHAESASTVHANISAATLGTSLVPALEIFADVLLRPHLDDEEVEPIRDLSLQALRSLEDDPGSLVMLDLRRRHYPDPWGRASVGTAEGLSSAQAEDLRGFFKDRYRPNGAILGIAGSIDWPALRDAIERLFGGWSRRADSTLDERPGGPQIGHVVRETQQTQIALALPSVTLRDPEYYQARAVAEVLGGSASSRLFQEVREKRGLCYSVSASYEAVKGHAALVCYSGTSADRAQQTLDVVCAELEQLRRSGATREELDIMRAGLKTSLLMQQESSMSRSALLAADWYHLGRVRTLSEIAGALDALTPETVSAHARGLPLESATVATLGPAPLVIPLPTTLEG